MAKKQIKSYDELMAFMAQPEVRNHIKTLAKNPPAGIDIGHIAAMQALMKQYEATERKATINPKDIDVSPMWVDVPDEDDEGYQPPPPRKVKSKEAYPTEGKGMAIFDFIGFLCMLMVIVWMYYMGGYAH